MDRSVGRTSRPAGPRGTRVLHLHPAVAEGTSRLWCVGREGSVRTVPSMPGLEHLRLLVERPRGRRTGTGAVRRGRSRRHGPGPGTLVDQQVLAEHRQRLREGNGQDDVPVDPVDHGAELAERARARIRREIRTALARLELHDGEVAHELRTTIRTGVTCRYEPDPFRPVEWRLHSEDHATQPVA